MLKTSHRVIAGFVLHATMAGGIFVRLPEIQASLGITEAVYGIVLMGMPIGVLSGSLTVPRFIERLGGNRVVAAGLMVSTLIQTLVPLAPGAASLGLVLFAYGLAFAWANVGINVQATRYEADSRATIMSQCHGWWALGFLAMSLVAAGFVQLGVTPFWQFVGQAVTIWFFAAVLVLPTRFENPAPAGQKASRFAVPGRSVLLLGAWAMAGLMLEGTTRGWIVIYVRDSYQAPEALAAMALPTIILTQTIGRFVADGLITRFGVVRVSRASAVVLALGIVLIAFAPTVPVVLAGCLLIGLGIAITMPQAFAAASRLGDRPAADSVAAFATLSTLIGFAGPPLFGGLAEVIGLHIAFALFLPVAILSYVLSPLLRNKSAQA